MELIKRRIIMVMLSFSMLGTITLTAQAAEKKENFGEEYQSQETLELYMQAYAALYSDATYEYMEAPEVNLAEFYAERIQLSGSFSDYFTKVEWIDRNGEISLSIYPKDILFGKNYDNPNQFMAHVDYAFSLIKDKFSSSSYWDNGESMYAQFHCHAMFAGDSKTPWNIEPWRTETNLFKVIAAKCNP